MNRNVEGVIVSIPLSGGVGPLGKHSVRHEFHDPNIPFHILHFQTLNVCPRSVRVSLMSPSVSGHKGVDSFRSEWKTFWGGHLQASFECSGE